MKRRMWIISYIGTVLLLFAFWAVKAEAREGGSGRLKLVLYGTGWTYDNWMEKA